MENIPQLFGINRSNRDYTNPDTWGKNQFNSSFPTALACYMYSKVVNPVYIQANPNMTRKIGYISVDHLFGINPLGDDIYFSFETQYVPFQKYVVGQIPRNDLVIISNNQCVSSLEIKLVALPDNPTCSLTDDKYGSEIVVRPDTIIYLACSIIQSYNDDSIAINNAIGNSAKEVNDWTEARDVLPHLGEIYRTIRRIVKDIHTNQIPLIMEPVWKTEGKSSKLADNCLDIFIWSNLGVLNLFMPQENEEFRSISRHTRTMIWLFKMLQEYVENGNFNGAKIIDELSYNTKNDKAFASNGLRTRPVMACKELTKPRITKNEIRNIILGGGQNLLSPERRFDAIIYNSPDLFSDD